LAGPDLAVERLFLMVKEVGGDRGRWCGCKNEGGVHIVKAKIPNMTWYRRLQKLCGLRGDGVLRNMDLV
jgi:hypothetical protein